MFTMVVTSVILYSNALKIKDHRSNKKVVFFMRVFKILHLSFFFFFLCRLWGDHGQEALESAHVCLINATATGTEILKNLVLPGIIVLLL